MAERITVRIDPDIKELVPGFLDNRRRDVARLQELVTAGAFAEIRLLGHSMKGAGGGYGFDRISELGLVPVDATRVGAIAVPISLDGYVRAMEEREVADRAACRSSSGTAPD